MADAIALVGTYAKSGGEGLYPLFRASNGRLTLGTPLPQAQNASFAAYSPRHGLYHLVDESEDGAVGAYRWDGTSMQPAATISTRGAEPCYVSLHPAETYLAVANYASGSIAVIPLEPQTGLPTGDCHVRRNSGSGPVSDRQEGPHAHCAIFSPADDWLFQTDLGADEILAFPWDAREGVLGDATSAYRAPPGSGPRHLQFSGDGARAYLVCELAATITVLRVDGSRLVPHQTQPLLAEPFEGENLGGHLWVDPAGRSVVASNRGHDSIAFFDVAADGTLQRGPLVSSGGQSPRQFVHVGEELLVVNEESGSLRRLAQGQDGAWRLVGAPLRVPGAAFVIELTAPQSAQAP